MAKHRLTIVPHLGCLLGMDPLKANTDIWVLGMVGSPEYKTAIRAVEVVDVGMGLWV